MPIARLLPLVLGGPVFLAVLPVLVLGNIGAADNTSKLLRDEASGPSTMWSIESRRISSRQSSNSTTSVTQSRRAK